MSKNDLKFYLWGISNQILTLNHGHSYTEYKVVAKK